jgi:hypothetical protein
MGLRTERASRRGGVLSHGTTATPEQPNRPPTFQRLPKGADIIFAKPPSSTLIDDAEQVIPRKV